MGAGLPFDAAEDRPMPMSLSLRAISVFRVHEAAFSNLLDLSLMLLLQRQSLDKRMEHLENMTRAQAALITRLEVTAKDNNSALTSQKEATARERTRFEGACMDLCLVRSHFSAFLSVLPISTVTAAHLTGTLPFSGEGMHVQTRRSGSLDLWPCTPLPLLVCSHPVLQCIGLKTQITLLWIHRSGTHTHRVRLHISRFQVAIYWLSSPTNSLDVPVVCRGELAKLFTSDAGAASVS
jgi:hypothetical protein